MCFAYLISSYLVYREERTLGGTNSRRKKAANNVAASLNVVGYREGKVPTIE